MWVVKLGGSLYDAPELTDWLTALAGAGRGRAVIVPGGGPFAEQVRAAQSHWRFGDAAAHAMAVLGMEQYGHMLVAMEPILRPARSREQVAQALEAGAVPVWLPVAMVEAATDIPAGWDVTSDSLSAWLAAQIGASRLALVKSEMPRPGRHAASTLAVEGLIDARFHQFLGRAPLRAWWLGRGDYPLLPAFLDGASPPAEILPA